MANTINTLNNANTFLDWINVTNSLVYENNAFATSAYTKPTGALILSDPTTGLIVLNGATFNGITRVTGAGSSLQVDNDANVSGQMYVSGNVFSATNATGYFESIITTGPVTVGGAFAITGTTTYASNNFIISTGVGSPITSYFGVYRPSATDAFLRWNENNKYWEMNDVSSNTFYRVITDEYRSDSFSISNSTNIATSNAVNGVYVTLQGQLAANVSTLQSEISTNTASLQSQITANTLSLQSQINSNVAYLEGIAVTQNLNTDYVNTFAASSYSRANTSANNFSGTSGTATPSSGSITINSTNGVTVSGSGSTLTINTPQDLRTSASPNFNNLTINSQQVLDAANYNSYAPTLTGTGASGTWGINISGTASNITAYTVNQSVGTGNNVQFNSLGIGTLPSGTTGEIRATNNITAYFSDDRLKTRIGNIENALEKVLSLNGFHYQANEVAQALGYKVKPEVGVSAQEVQAILPEVVVPAPIDEKYLTVHYEKLIPLLIEAIKELKAEIEELKK